MAEEVQGQADEALEESESSEATIAVHWREEGYYAPPAKFIGQANAADPAIRTRFAEENFPECFREYADLLHWDRYWDTTLDTSNAPFWKWFVGGKLNASYNVSKGGINQLTRVMALALADKGIRVNAVAPGTIATELAAKAVLTSEEARKRIMSRTPMKRLGEPSEIADAVAWLASDASSYVTGEIVVVDGGRMTLNYPVAV